MLLFSEGVGDAVRALVPRVMAIEVFRERDVLS
jgi:hypothetical protein